MPVINLAVISHCKYYNILIYNNIETNNFVYNVPFIKLLKVYFI